MGENGLKKKKKRREREGIQVWGLTSKQYSLKNLSSTTNKDTRPELSLIIAAYSPWLGLQLGTHQYLLSHRWQALLMPPPSPYILQAVTHASKCKHTHTCTQTIHAYKQMQILAAIHVNSHIHRQTSTPIFCSLPPHTTTYCMYNNQQTHIWLNSIKVAKYWNEFDR